MMESAEDGFCNDVTKPLDRTRNRRVLNQSEMRPDMVSAAEERVLGKARLSTERVLRELERAIFADPRKLYDEKGRLKPIHTLDDDTAATIASFDTDEIGPQRRAIGRTTKVRFVDKLVAIDRAMKHLGLYERDNRQWESNLTIQVGLVAAPPRKLIYGE